jgi:iron complex transport system permease protein
MIFNKNVSGPSITREMRGAGHARTNGALAISLLITGLIIMSIVAMTTGRYPIKIHDLLSIVWKTLAAHGAATGDASRLVLFKVRLPRMLAAIFVGAMLSGAGACYQGIFRNPMVEPRLLGVTHGAAFGAALAILLSFNVAMIQVTSFVFGLIAVTATVGMAAIVGRRGDKTLTLLLCGIITFTLFEAFLSITKYVADPYSKLPAITYWWMGSLSAVTMADLRFAALFGISGLIPLFLLRWRINTMTFGDDEAKTLGINTRVIRTVAIASSTIMTASAVSVSGVIGWIGLVIPHLARMIVGPSFTILLPVSVLLGALFLLFVDTLARVLFPIEVPLGILTAIIGAPFFIALLARGKRGWS